MQNKINLGDVFYLVEKADTKIYNSTCRLCEGKRELTIKGFTFRCPMCDKEQETLRVHGYKVTRYRVYSITESIPDNDWKMDDRRRIHYGLYHKDGKGYSSYNSNHKRITIGERGFNERFLNVENTENRNISDLIYNDYKLAVWVADKKTAESIDEVRKFNAKHNTNYELPQFDIKHDKKSN